MKSTTREIEVGSGGAVEPTDTVLFSSQGKWCCSECGEKCASFLKLRKHAIEEHKVTLLVRCDKCREKVTETAVAMARHTRVCTVEVEKTQLTVRCEHCTRSFETYAGMRAHVSKSHKVKHNESLPEKKVFLCEDVELMDLAEKEILKVVLPGLKYPNKALAVFHPNRSKQAIGKIRTGDRYKTIYGEVWERISKEKDNGAKQGTEDQPNPGETSTIEEQPIMETNDIDPAIDGETLTEGEIPQQ